MELLASCPVCTATQFEHFKSCTDYSVSKQTFDIVFCKNCGLKFTNPRPNAKEIGPYYDSPEYISHSNKKTGFFSIIYQIIRKRAIKQKITWIKTLPLKGKNLLDIGCGTGEFLNEAQKDGFTVQGIEPSDKARNQAVNNYKLVVGGEEQLSSIERGTQDVITMWHVLEHVHDLRERVQQIHDLLKPGGFAIIAVPNYTSLDANHYGSFWAAYDVPRHLYHFSPDVIKQLFRSVGLKHIRSIPMKFDSFYVSMLSSRYKKESIPAANGFINGLRSNLKAGADPECYSSVVYVFEKTI